VTNGQYEKQPVHYSDLVTWLAGTHTLSAVVVGADGVEHPNGPAFTLVVAPGTGGPLPPDAIRITGFEALGGGRFELRWEAVPQLQGAVFEIQGSVEIGDAVRWRRENALSITPNSAIIEPGDNRFFRVKAR